MTIMSFPECLRWSQAGGSSWPTSILKTTVHLFGLEFEATAIQVEQVVFQDTATGRNAVAQRGVSAIADLELIKWNRATEIVGAYQELMIDGRPYVVFLRPRIGGSTRSQRSRSLGPSGT